MFIPKYHYYLTEFSQEMWAFSQTLNFYAKSIFLLEPHHLAPPAMFSHSDSFPELSVAPRQLRFVRESWDRAKQTIATYKGPVDSQFSENFPKNNEPRLLQPRERELNWFPSSKPIFLRWLGPPKSMIFQTTVHFIHIPESQDLPKALRIVWQSPRNVVFCLCNFTHLYLLFHLLLGASKGIKPIICHQTHFKDGEAKTKREQDFHSKVSIPK